MTGAGRFGDLTESIKSANDNLSRSNTVAQDNSSGLPHRRRGRCDRREPPPAGSGGGPICSRRRSAAVVNEMRAPALAAANTALAGVAAGIVTATNYAGTRVVALAGAAEKASPSLLGFYLRGPLRRPPPRRAPPAPR